MFAIDTGRVHESEPVAAGAMDVGGKKMRRRKPDFLAVLVVLVLLGILFTGISQAMMRNSPSPVVAEARK